MKFSEYVKKCQHEAFLERMKRPWDWGVLCRNSLPKLPNYNALIEEECLKKWVAANKIKIRVFWDPVYKIGRKRIERSFEAEEYSVVT